MYVCRSENKDFYSMWPARMSIVHSFLTIGRQLVVVISPIFPTKGPTAPLSRFVLLAPTIITLSPAALVPASGARLVKKLPLEEFAGFENRLRHFF